MMILNQKMLHEFCRKTLELHCELREDNLELIHNRRMKKSKHINSGTTTKLVRMKGNDPGGQLSAFSSTMTKTLTFTRGTVSRVGKRSAAEIDEI